MPLSLAQPRLDRVMRAADARPTTWRDADRSIEAVAATETPVRTWIYDYCVGRSYECDEILDISGLTDAEVQAFVGCPIVDSHSTWSAMDIVGVVIEARRENENRDLVVRFSIDETETTIASKVKSGTIRKVSIGALRRREGATMTQRDGQVPLRRSPVDLAELSLVAVPADPNATTRAAGRSGPSVRDIADPASTRTQDENMKTDAIRSAMAAFSTAAAAFTTQMTAALDETPAPAGAAADATRAAPTASPAAPAPDATRAAPAAPAPAAPAADVVQRSAADTAQIAGWRAVAATRGRQTEFDAMVAGGSDMGVLRKLVDGYVTTVATPTNGSATEPLQPSTAERSSKEFVSFERAVDAQRSGGGGDAVAQLTDALAKLAQR